MGKKRIIQKTEESFVMGQKDPSAGSGEVRVGGGRRLQSGLVYIFSSYNNTIMTLTDATGNTLAWVSAGRVGFKGTRKSTPYAASKVAEAIVQIAQKLGITNISVYVKGVGGGRDSAVRSLAARGLEIDMLKDVTPMPHNGCRPPKVRRV